MKYAIMMLLAACGSPHTNTISVFIGTSEPHEGIIAAAVMDWVATCDLDSTVVFEKMRDVQTITVLDVDKIGQDDRILGHAQKLTDIPRVTVVVRKDLSDEDYRFTALHELGHVWGLSHSKGGLMSPKKTDDDDVSRYCSLVRDNLKGLQ